MGTSRSELHLPETVDPEEAAAITAAIRTLLREERATAVAAESSDTTDSWSGNRWTFAGRMAALQGRTSRAPDGAPTDPWTAAGRTDRF
ncbi:MAG: acc operon protein [Halobacteriales archaeon]|nr:acc operon protein [Halobacteriales archaeon]